MIRVLNIINRLDCGGMEYSVVNYYRHLDRSKVQYCFLFTEDEGGDRSKQFYEDEVLSLGAQFFWRPTRSRHPIKNVRALFKILKDNPDIQIIHVYHPRPVKPALDCFWAMLKGIQARISYGALEVRSNYPIIQKMFRPLLRATSTHLLAASAEAGISMYGKKAKDKIIIVPRARDLDIFRYHPDKRLDVRQKMGLNDYFVIINVGRLDLQKNQLFLIDAFACALKYKPDMILLFAGDGNLQSQLIIRAKELGVDSSVRFLGLCDNIPDLLQAADLFVLPSLFEGLPGAVVEAQIAGLPCLLSDTITKESKLTDAVNFIPIDKGAEIWAERMVAYTGFERVDTTEEIRRKGYDIKEAAKWLEEFYIDALKR